MSKRIEAIVEPALLIWARESLGFDVHTAAKKIQVKPEKLELWEKGDAKPSIAQLKKLAHLYKRPLAVFYLPSPPKDFDALRDFRRLAEAQPIVYSSEFLLLMRDVQEKREMFLELLEIIESDVEEFKTSITRSQHIPSVALDIRKLLGVTFEKQLSWKNLYEALNVWKMAIESLGVLVFQSSEVLVSEMRGFSIYNARYPVIVINAKDSPAGRIFTLLHEFTHLALKDGGICDLEERGLEKDTEVFCNYAAGEILVPEIILKERSEVKSVSGTKDWTDDELKNMADAFRVSTEVILRRLVIIRKATNAFYERKRKEFKEYSDALRKEKKKGGFMPVPDKVVRNYGKAYVQTVLNAYYSDSIGASAVSDYLGVRLKHLDKITMLSSNYERREKVAV